MAKMVSYAKQLEKQKKLYFATDIAKFTDRQIEAMNLILRQFWPDPGCPFPIIKFLLYGGALGGGKSYFLRWILVLLLMAWFQLKGLKKVQVMLACEDFPTLKDRQLSKISIQFPLWLGRSYSDHKDYGRCYLLNDEYGGGIICFRNLDDASKYQSSEWAAIAVDELTKNELDVFTDLRMRMRWPGLKDEECPFIGGTNPGGIGHNYVKALWMDQNFPVEFIQPIDYRPMFAYVPSKAEDNPYLDSGYWQMLNTLPPHLRAAFRDGSWDTFVGQAFQEWSRMHHVIESPKPLVPEGRPLYMTFDWGFGKPFSVGWWWIDSDGRKYRFAEWYGWNGTPDQGLRLPDSEIAEGIIKREYAMGFTVDQGTSPKVINPQIQRLCDPTCFNKKPDYRGGGQGASTAEVFMNMGLQMRPGDPSRVLKWRQFHEHLRIPRDVDGKVNGVSMLQIYSSCQHFIRTVPSLIVDPNNIEDVESSGEDHCIVGRTLVDTENGPIYIEELLNTEGMVFGLDNKLYPYYNVRKIRSNESIVRLTFEDGRTIECTPDHKFLMEDGSWLWADRAEGLGIATIIPGLSTKKSKNFKGTHITGTGGGISRIGSEGSYIGLFGDTITEKSRQKCSSIISTEILQTIKKIILRSLPIADIKKYIAQVDMNTRKKSFGMLGRLAQLGMLKKPVSCVKRLLWFLGWRQIRFCIADNIAEVLPDINERLDLESQFARYAEKNLKQNVGAHKRAVTSAGGLCVVKVEKAGRADVYCLDVGHHSHTFSVCGGILTHNCGDEAALLFMARPLTQLPVKEEKKVPPKDITEIAALEREQIWDEIRAAEEREKTEQMFY